MRSLLFAAAVTGLAGGAAGAATPLDTSPNNGAGYTPAFPGQTRAPAAAPSPPLTVTTFASGLAKPWAMEFLPDGRMIVTELPGRIRLIAKDGTVSRPVTGVPKVVVTRQGGLLDIAVDPDFARNQMIYFSYAEPREGGRNGTTLARARLVADGAGGRLEGLQILFRQTPAWRSDLHFGSRIVFGRDGTLFLALGERSLNETRVQSQDLGGHLGKVVRLNRDGTVPRDNPFVGRAGARPEIWSYGHRNIQSAALDPRTGVLWTIEHGPRGGDELNRTEAGKNYGWPVISYGLEYSGLKLPGGRTARPGLEQPVYYWDPVIAPSGMLFYTGAMFPAWRNSLFVGGLVTTKLVRLVMADGKVVGEEWLLRDQKERIRDVQQGPDGALYVSTDNPEGRILRITLRR